MSDKVTMARQALVRRVLEGQGVASREASRAAFEHRGVPEAVRPLVDKVVRHAWKVTDADVNSARAAGVSEDEIFELTICAAIGQATRQIEAGLAALDRALAEEGSPRQAAADGRRE